ncbi:L-aminoadipate-semialdehyde dehydrogenase-phosphopantetheinyl transferase [Anoplophora glabripennis]|uniref:L-aminoadipate-semialdehyde dehydrogenase-phosphopantetheinyl transferase n=1 Tax=Anoplophora glabripennis TaxID=217634 RepID=UPI000C76C340|nr:L-aminoadipate-semialdehyde dehydrogenase-phosphopantetheinyl transferase [Anoplophora glabripennis]
MNIFKMTNTSVRWAFNFTKWNPSHSDMLLASSCVQTEEKDRLSRFYFRKDFKSSLIGRLMMRKFVCQASGKKYDEIKFLRDDKGKPMLFESNTYPNLDFNISHQGDYVVLAGECSNVKLGVDVMKLEYSGGKSLDEFFRLMTKNFSPEEWVMIKSSGTEKQQIAMFCRHWCLKESYVKAIGVGITINLQDIRFKVNTSVLDKNFIVDDTELYIKGMKVNWKFQEMLLDDQHCVAVALNDTSNMNLVFREIDFSELMEGCVPFLPRDEQYCLNYFRKCERP